jgi:hypothetical protein
MPPFDPSRKFEYRVAIEPSPENIAAALDWLLDNSLRWCVDYLNRESQIMTKHILGSSYQKNVFEFNDPSIAVLFKLQFGGKHGC